MRRLCFVFAFFALFGLTAPLSADEAAVVSSVTRQLEAQGYKDVEVSRSFLGRLKFEAERGGYEREIVINPNTGEVLRDQTYRDDEDGPVIGGHQGGKSGKGNSGSSKDDRDDDDDDNSGSGKKSERDDDDDDDDDRSGSGSDRDDDDDDDDGDSSGSGSGGGDDDDDDDDDDD